MIKGMDRRELSKSERELLYHLGESIANWIETHQTERGELIAAISLICVMIFTKETPIKDIDKQCEEIDSFCDYIKFMSRKG